MKPVWKTPLEKPRMKPTPRTVPGTAMASMETNSMKPRPAKRLLTTRYAMTIERRAVSGAAMSDRPNESAKASKPWWRVKTWMNHLGVSE